MFARRRLSGFHIRVGTVLRMMAAGYAHHTPQHSASDSQPRSDQHHNGHSEAHGFLRSLLFVSL
jgi:hypothetical protein